jgi:unspecific monooxygenase
MSQVEAFLTLRRNPLELWGRPAYEQLLLPGRFLGREQVLLNDPEGIRHVLMANHANYRRNIGTHRVLAPVLGSGLFLAEGDAWKRQRRTIAPAFAPRTMPVLARHVIHAAEEEMAALRGMAGRPVELLPRLQRLALTIAGRSMFSLEMERFGEELRALLIRYAERWVQPGVLDLVLPGWIPSPLDLGRSGFRAEWMRFVDRMIDARLAEGTPDEMRPRDLFDLLATARDPETGARFGRAQLRDEVSTMILAGHETTAAALFWAFYIAARMPEWQEAMAEEAGAADLSPEGAAASMAGLPRVRAHIDETLRLYPPAFLIVREAKEEDVVAGHRVAPGTVISVSPWILGRHRKLWDRPEEFRPERFMPGAPPPDRFAYMPFGIGPRICVGARFALTEAVLVMAALLRGLRVEPWGRGYLVPRGLVTTQPDRPVRFVLHAR